MIGKGRKDARQQARLNIGRNLELALDPFLGGGGLGQVLDVLLERRLHGLKVVGENTDFVVRVHRWQCHVKVSGSDLIGRCSQQLERFYDGPGNVDDRQGQQQYPGKTHRRHGHAQLSDILQKLRLGEQDGKRPACRRDRRVIHPAREAYQALVVDEAGLAPDHFLAEFPQEGVLTCFCNAEERFVHDGVLQRVSQYRPVAGKQGCIAGPEYLDRGDVLRQGVEGNVCTDNPLELFLAIDFLVEGHRTGRHQNIAGAFIEVRLAPFEFAQLTRNLVPIPVQDKGKCWYEFSRPFKGDLAPFPGNNRVHTGAIWR